MEQSCLICGNAAPFALQWGYRHCPVGLCEPHAQAYTRGMDELDFYFVNERKQHEWVLSQMLKKPRRA
jgi:hypothetical protein